MGGNHKLRFSCNCLPKSNKTAIQVAPCASGHQSALRRRETGQGRLRPTCRPPHPARGDPTGAKKDAEEFIFTYRNALMFSPEVFLDDIQSLPRASPEPLQSFSRAVQSLSRASPEPLQSLSRASPGRSPDEAPKVPNQSARQTARSTT